MASASLARAKVDAEARQNEEKRRVEVRKNIIVLTARFLQDLGYCESARQVQSETNVSLDKIDVADNIDLPTILHEYEEYYEMRFGRRPKITRKGDGAGSLDRKQSLPKLNSRKQQDARPESPPYEPHVKGITDQHGAPERGHLKRQSSTGKPPRESSRKPAERPSSAERRKEDQSLDGGLGVAGNNVSKLAKEEEERKQKKEEEEKKAAEKSDPFDNRLLKPLGGMLNVPGIDKEYAELASAITRDICVRNPGVTWNTIIGLEDSKALLKEAVVMPLKYPHLFTGLLTPWKGVLLFGPPGTGKTLLAKAVATECETTFFNISASTIVSKWRGDSEKLIRVMFDVARYHQPSTIFIDELDSIMSARGGGEGEHEGSRRMKTELLIQMDGLMRDANDRIFLLAASNLPWDLDSAMLRRLEKRILVDLPCVGAREAMLRKSLPDGFANGLEYERLAQITDGWSGSDMQLLCKEAAMHPLRRLMTQIECAGEKGEVPEIEDCSTPSSKSWPKVACVGKPKQNPEDLQMGPVTPADIERALQTVHPAPSAHREKYKAWMKEFGAA